MATQGYIGRAPGDSSVIVARQTFTPTGITTNFTFASGYTVGYVDAYLNGARLIEGSDYTATDGSVVGLTTHAQNGDVLELVVYKAFNIGDVQAAKNDFSVGGDLSVTGVATVTGAITATGGVVGNVTGDATGLSGTPDLTIRNLTGVAATFTGVLTYDDVTNVDAVGYSTFREGINVQGAGSTTTTLNVSGVTTMTGDVNLGADFNIPDAITHVGDSDTKIRFPAADTFTVETAGAEKFRISNVGAVQIKGSTANMEYLRMGGNNDRGLRFTSSSGTSSVGVVHTIDAPGDSGNQGELVLQTNSTERLRINSSGNVSIGGTEGITYSLLNGLAINVDNGDAGIIVNSSSSAHNAYISFGYGDSGAVSHADQFSAYIGRVGDDTLAFGTGNSLRARIDSSGRLLLGTSTSRSVGTERNLQVEGTNGANSSISVVRNSNTTGGPSINIGKSRGTSVNTDTIVQNNDTLGTINFRGADGVDLNGVSAAISAAVDGTPGSDDTPGRLIFSTTADGANTATERLRIDSSGRLLKSGQASLTSTTLNHPIQVAAASDANAIVILGRAADDIGELSYYENDASTKLGEIQYRQDHVNIRHRVGEIRFATAGVTDRMIINSGGDVNITGITTASQFDATSDVALKENIEVIDEPINKLSELKGVTFDWKAGGHSVGVIAQDVEKVLPTAVGGNKDQKTVNYNAIIGLLVESVKDQQKQIEELKSLLDK